MFVKGIIDEDFVNYKKPSMVIEFPKCDFKCDKECGQIICQNRLLVFEPNIEIPYEKIIDRYLENPITEALVFQGLEPFDSLKDLLDIIFALRGGVGCKDDIVIYTGYTKEEVELFTYDKAYPILKDTSKIIPMLKQVGNIIIKYGRYIPNQTPHYDEVLGVYLASDNQYAERLENEIQS